MKIIHPVLLAVVLAAAGAAGCNTTVEPTPVAANPAASEVEPSNATDVGPTVATDPLPAPPEIKVEVPGAAPSEHHVWIEGYWWWDHPKHVYVWSPGFWQDRVIFAGVAPPALIYENPYRAPSNEYLWIPGYWIWRGNEYVWYHGYWSYHRDGWAYVHPYWEAVGGHWHCAGWGWERYTADWEQHHAGWSFHGGVWERPVEWHARVALASAHANDYRVSPGTWHGHIHGRADADAHAHSGSNVHPGEAVREPVQHDKAPERHTPEAKAEPHPKPSPTEGHPSAAHPHYDTHPDDEHHHHPGEHK